MTPALDSFEDDLTRELPSALRTFTDLAPISDGLAEDILEIDEHDLIPMAEHEHTVRIPRPASASVPEFALDLGARGALRPWEHPLALTIGAALLVACALAGIIGIVAGRSVSPGNAEEARLPRVAIVAAASELVTIPAPSAPGKSIAPAPRAAPRPTARPTVARVARPPAAPLTPSGRGHMGSDRH